MKHLYSRGRTHLDLTEKAGKVCAYTDPFDIEEIETEDGYRYNVIEAYDRENLTEKELISYLEDIYDAGQPVTVDSFGAEIPQNWEEIADFLNHLIDGGYDSRDVWEDYWNGDIPDAPKAIVE